MDPVKEAQMARALGLSPLLALLPFVETEVDKAQETLVKHVLGQLRTRTLTPEAALAAWMEYAAYESLLIRLNQRAKQGRSDAEAMSGELTGPAKRG